jgi:ATPase subunit of ABC transporter with duplicated ATPase domains
MIRLDNISKQNGSSSLHRASAALQRGEKIGLVGPNGAGKTTLFRMITGQRSRTRARCWSTGASHRLLQPGCGRDVGPQRGGRGDGRRRRRQHGGRRAARARGSAGRPGPEDELDSLVERFGEVQARFEALGGYALEAGRGRCWPGLSFSQEMMDGDVGHLSGGWKMRVALARILLMRPTSCCWTSRATTSTSRA